jgi:hypothetical protein
MLNNNNFDCVVHKFACLSHQGWDKPPGLAVRGVDTFKLLCSVNDPHKEPAVVVGDSGAAPTLISEEFLTWLTLSKPRL